MTSRTPIRRPPPPSPGLVALLLLVVLALAACGPAGGAGGGDERPLVVSSIFPVGDLVASLGGETVRVEVLLPPRASPSAFEPTARQVARLSRAAAYVFIGGGMDRWAERLADEGGRVVRLTEGMSLLEGHAHEGEPGTGNPHVWLDPLLVRDHVLPRLEALLVELMPLEARALRVRGAALSDSLTALDAEIRAALADVPTRSFVSSHAAWSYFANRYGLKELGAVYESPGREPSARHLVALVEAARADGTRAVFVEPQLGEAGARTVAAELGTPLHLLDPQGGAGQEGREDYFSLMRYNTNAMVEALGGGG